jgi:predicted esterase
LSLLTFPEISSRMFELYYAGQPVEALAFVNEHAGDVPDQISNIRIWQVCLQSLTGQTEQAKRTLEQTLDSGLWYHPEALTHDSDLAPLQDDPEYQSLVARSNEMYLEARQAARPELHVYTPPADAPTPYPALFVLHGMGGNADETAGQWQDLAGQGWLVAIPQSSQIVNVDGYAWDDAALTESELAVHFEQLCAEYPLDRRRIVLAGFSQGGGLAISLSLQGSLPSCGFIGVAPWLPTLEALLHAPTPAMDRPLRGVILTGGKDVPQVAMFDKFEALFEKRGLPYQRCTFPDLAHSYPPDFANVRSEALAFILPPD